MPARCLRPPTSSPLLPVFQRKIWGENVVPDLIARGQWVISRYPHFKSSSCEIGQSGWVSRASNGGCDWLCHIHAAFPESKLKCDDHAKIYVVRRMAWMLFPLASTARDGTGKNRIEQEELLMIEKLLLPSLLRLVP